MDKFGRNYELQVQTDTGYLTIGPPFTIEFDIIRNTLTSANMCKIRLYNLATATRNKIRFNNSDYANLKGISLRAGYGKNLPVIFTGNMTEAWSMREGVNFITQIECLDGGFAFVNGQANLQFPAGTPNIVKIAELAKTLPATELGAIGNYEGVSTRGNAYSGNTAELLKAETGGGFFIDNGKANALKTNEYIADGVGISVIDASSGLLGTPMLERTIVTFDMLFEPGLNPGRKCRIESSTEANFNGDYVVTAVKHRGMISEAVCGSVITTGEFFYTKLLAPVGEYRLGR